MRPTFLVLSCPVKLADGSIGVLCGAADGLQIRHCATWWGAWLGYLTQVALLRASPDIWLDLAVIDCVRDTSALMRAAEREYTMRGMSIPYYHQERNESDGIPSPTMGIALQHGALS